MDAYAIRFCVDEIIKSLRNNDTVSDAMLLVVLKAASLHADAISPSPPRLTPREQAVLDQLGASP